jgi:hypothetical protein
MGGGEGGGGNWATLAAESVGKAGHVTAEGKGRWATWQQRVVTFSRPHR